MWEKVKLGEVCTIFGGYAFKSEQYVKNAIPLVRISNITENQIILDDECSIEENSKYNQFEILNGDILVALSGATTGKFGVYKYYERAYLNQRVALIRKTDQTCQKFIFYYLNQIKEDILRKAGGAAQPNISTSELGKFEIPLPPLPIQEKIATILDKADELRRKDKDLQAKYDELVQAIFIDMFGDPVKNEKGWEVKKLEELGYLKNGLNYGNNESGKELKVFGVGNFESNWLFDDYNNLKSLNLDTIPNKSFLLADGDILFVRSNGNKDLIGRAVLLKNINTEITYSGFCIKFTKTSSAVNAYYLIRLLVNSKFKKYILNGGRGANIQNINQEILSSLNIPVPPLHLQEAFAKKIELINQLKAQTNAQKSEELFQSLLQKAFKGELVS